MQHHVTFERVAADTVAPEPKLLRTVGHATHPHVSGVVSPARRPPGRGQDERRATEMQVNVPLASNVAYDERQKSSLPSAELPWERPRGETSMPLRSTHSRMSDRAITLGVRRVCSRRSPVSGEVECEASQLVMACRSYVCPSAVTTGSSRSSWVMGQTKDGGRSTPANERARADLASARGGGSGGGRSSSSSIEAARAYSG
eukprot:scaffold97192_cov26-Tisochrysis_lutea.AAC.2